MPRRFAACAVVNSGSSLSVTTITLSQASPKLAVPVRDALYCCTCLLSTLLASVWLICPFSCHAGYPPTQPGKPTHEPQRPRSPDLHSAALDPRHLDVPMSAVGQWHAFAAVLATMPDVIERLSEIHRPTADGRWCRGCTTPGRGTLNTPWPCSIAALLADASHHRATADENCRKASQDRPVAGAASGGPGAVRRPAAARQRRSAGALARLRGRAGHDGEHRAPRGDHARRDGAGDAGGNWCEESRAADAHHGQPGDLRRRGTRRPTRGHVPMPTPHHTEDGGASDAE
jgi:hypothetical protein